MGLLQPVTIRVLLLSAQGLCAFSWRRGALLADGRFAADEAGRLEFVRYLSELPDAPLYLVADIIEEDFRLESVAHVVGRDRTALLERKLAQFFRTSEYRAARIQGREEGGRRDDTVLFCALTNNDQMAFWVETILGQRAPLRGVLSASWLIERLAGGLGLDGEAHVLVVNLQEQSGLRQTYLQRGQLKFSRLSPRSVLRAENPAEMIVAECVHTRQYLERLKLLPRDRPLEVHVIAQGEIGGEVEGGLTADGSLRFHCHASAVVAARLGIDPALEEGRGAVFVALMQALRSGRLNNIYGSGRILRHDRLRRIRRALMVGAWMLFAGMLGHGFLLLVDGLNRRAGQQGLERELEELSRQYQQRLGELPDTPIPVGAMRGVVALGEALERQAAISKDMITPLSRVLADCPDIQPLKVIWRLAADPEADRSGVESGAADPFEESRHEQAGSSALLPALLSGQTHGTIFFEGMVSPADGYLAVHGRVVRFIRALETTANTRVFPLAMPADTSPDSSLKATLDGRAIEAGFSLRLDCPAPVLEETP